MGSGAGGAEYLLLTEDDATMCEGHLGRLSAGIAAASRVDREWSMLRTSIGFIGIAIKRADANALADFLERHYRVKPPDILLVEWAHGDWEGSVRAAHAAKSGRTSRGETPQDALRRHQKRVRTHRRCVFVAHHGAESHARVRHQSDVVPVGHGAIQRRRRVRRSGRRPVRARVAKPRE